MLATNCGVSKLRSLLPLLFVCTLAAPLNGQTLAELNWQSGPLTASLGDKAGINVPEGFAFLGPEDTQKMMELMGNIVSGFEAGLIYPGEGDWFIVFEFNPTGYIKDDDKDELDADGILQRIREGTEAANEIRRERGFPDLTIVGWEHPPRYNTATNNLEWAIRAVSEQEPVVNYNTRLLGRRGVMEVALVIDPAELQEKLPTYQELLGTFDFRQGERYAEYQPGDKLAAYGLTALIAGGAGAVAAKTGLLAALGKLIAKCWKILIVALIGVGAFLKRFFTGGSRHTTPTEPTP